MSGEMFWSPEYRITRLNGMPSQMLAMMTDTSAMPGDVSQLIWPMPKACRTEFTIPLSLLSIHDQVEADTICLDLVVDAQQRQRDRELGPAGLRHRPDQLAHLAGHGTGVGHHRQHLARHPVQPRDPVLRAPEHLSGHLRGRVARRRQWLETLLAHHLSALAARVGHHAAAWSDLHAQGGRRDLDHDDRWAW